MGCTSSHCMAENSLQTSEKFRETLKKTKKANKKDKRKNKDELTNRTTRKDIVVVPEGVHYVADDTYGERQKQENRLVKIIDGAVVYPPVANAEMDTSKLRRSAARHAVYDQNVIQVFPHTQVAAQSPGAAGAKEGVSGLHLQPIQRCGGSGDLSRHVPFTTQQQLQQNSDRGRHTQSYIHGNHSSNLNAYSSGNSNTGALRHTTQYDQVMAMNGRNEHHTVNHVPFGLGAMSAAQQQQPGGLMKSRHLPAKHLPGNGGGGARQALSTMRSPRPPAQSDSQHLHTHPRSRPPPHHRRSHSGSDQLLIQQLQQSRTGLGGASSSLEAHAARARHSRHTASAPSSPKEVPQSSVFRELRHSEMNSKLATKLLHNLPPPAVLAAMIQANEEEEGGGALDKVGDSRSEHRSGKVISPEQRSHSAKVMTHVLAG